MRDVEKYGPRLRQSSADKSQVTLNRGGDVTSFRIGRARYQGDTAVAGQRPRRKPMDRYLLDLKVCGCPLNESEARHWARKMKEKL